MDKLLLLLIVPICWPIISRIIFGQTAVWGLSRMAPMRDYEIWNGAVTDKKQVKVSCSHSYPCNCRPQCSGIGENRMCYTVCDICYSHSNDWDWRVYTTVGSLNIARVDSRGSNEPKRWTQVKIGEPASVPYSYTNYIKAAPDTLFTSAGDYPQFNDLLPEYPEVYDYYRYNRVLNMGAVSSGFASELNKSLNDQLKTLGHKKEVNIIVVLVNTNDPTYRYALENKWVGGKKNDVIIVIGVTSPPSIDWADVITYALNYGNEHLQVVLRDRIKKLSLDSPEDLSYTVASTIDEHFNRTPMEEFEYLKNEVDPPTWLLLITAVVSIIVSFFLTIYFRDNDTF
jgi:hypothetical protein